MSGFSTEWLLLREPADRVARDVELLADLAADMAHLSDLHFADLGCGTGSNLRAIALAFGQGQRQHWRLYDHDRGLLLEARKALAAWADHSRDREGGLELQKDDREIHVRFCEEDLNRNIETVLRPGDIVTASAFFDLVSEGWISRFAAAAAAIQAAVYATLIYNGAELWVSPHPADGPMLAAFAMHQRRDKGFGPAAGPKAANVLLAALLKEGYKVQAANSPWRLNQEQRRLIEELAAGSAAAVAELRLFDDEVISAWRTSRAAAAACTIGHSDILAWPPD